MIPAGLQSLLSQLLLVRWYALNPTAVNTHYVFYHLMILEVEQFQGVILQLSDILKDQGCFDLSTLRPSACRFCLD